MYFTGSAFESESLATVAAGAVADSVAPEAEFRGWARPAFAVEIRTAKVSVRKTTHSVAHSQQDLEAICIRNDGRSFAQLSIGRCVRRVVFFAAWREKATGFYLQAVGAPVVCKRNPYHTLRRAIELARRLSMRDAAP